MRSIKLYAAGPLAMVATSSLFLVMQALVGGEADVKIEPDRPRFIPVIQDIVEEPPVRKSWDVERPEIIIIEDEWVRYDDDHEGPDDQVVVIGPPKPTVAAGPDFGGFGAQADGDFLPIVRVAAQYPRRAMQQGIEGYAIVELTVGADGTVSPGSITVVDAAPQGVFDKEAQKAAAKFKYKPRVVNGVAQPVSGVRYRFSFNLAE